MTNILLLSSLISLMSMSLEGVGLPFSSFLFFLICYLVLIFIFRLLFHFLELVAGNIGTASTNH